MAAPLTNAGLAQSAPGTREITPAIEDQIIAGAVGVETTRAEAAEAAGSVTTGQVTATGTDQGSAATLPYGRNIVVAAVAGAGAVLPATATQTIVVLNETSVAVLVYPPSGAQVDEAGMNLAVEIVAGGSAAFDQASPTQFYAE